MGSKVKEIHRNMAVISEALELVKESTSVNLAKKVNIEKLKVQKALAELKRLGYVTRGDHTGTGNEAVWSNLKPYVTKSKAQIDWSLYYSIFHNIVRARYEQV